MRLENNIGIFKAGICFLDKRFFWSENLEIREMDCRAPYGCSQ